MIIKKCVCIKDYKALNRFFIKGEIYDCFYSEIRSGNSGNSGSWAIHLLSDMNCDSLPDENNRCKIWGQYRPFFQEIFIPLIQKQREEKISEILK